MKKSILRSNKNFNAAAIPGQSYDMPDAIALTLRSAMENIYQIEDPIAVISKDEDEVFHLRLSCANPFDRKNQMGLLDLDHTLVDCVSDLVRGGYPLQYDMGTRTLEAPALEIYISLLSLMDDVATKPPLMTASELLEAHNHGGSTAPGLILH